MGGEGNEMAVVEMGRFNTRTEAELARGMLSAHGYITHVSDRSEHVYGRGETLGGGISLLVDDADVTAVHHLLTEAAVVPGTSPATDPHRSPFDTSTQHPRTRLAERIVWSVLGAYVLLVLALTILD